jgi:hypothetical protein
VKKKKKNTFSVLYILHCGRSYVLYNTRFSLFPWRPLVQHPPHCVRPKEPAHGPPPPLKKKRDGLKKKSILEKLAVDVVHI